ncbi:sodium-dependent bicarbonate transport family permease [Tundrisphaera sp. TA3]|uniref:sodium-dependent bicarbonate transport family permease n=1 Tax=Tundrisphaera sp. TA3 TaxID=3435775 RepID=UPI003EB9550E
MNEFLRHRKAMGWLGGERLHEVFLNPGLFLLFGGGIIGYISWKQGVQVTQNDDDVFIKFLQGLLCLFLTGMGMTVANQLPDPKNAGRPFIHFGLAAPTRLRH